MRAKLVSLSSSSSLLEARRVASSHALPLVSQIARVDDDGVWVLVPELAEPVKARLAQRIDRARLLDACASGQQTLLSFEQADPQRPIIMGLLESGPVEEELSTHGTLGDLTIDADADGKRVRVSARERIEFVCGKSSVTLTHRGRIVVRGTHVETHASDTNRIKGGRVRIN